MMISKEDIDKLAELARLELTESEKKEYASQMEEILQLMDQLKEVDTENVSATSQITGLENVFREDQVVGVDIKKEMLKNAPMTEDDYIKVKAVLE